MVVVVVVVVPLVIPLLIEVIVVTVVIHGSEFTHVVIAEFRHSLFLLTVVNISELASDARSSPLSLSHK